MENCLACDLINGSRDLPGGRIFQTGHWVVEHCIGPLGVGALIVKPFRHCLHVWELTEDETREIAPLLQRTSEVIHTLLSPDQVYICLWSHAGWQPGHIHFLLQPSWNHFQETHSTPGPYLQVDMYEANAMPPRPEIERFAEQARNLFR